MGPRGPPGPSGSPVSTPLASPRQHISLAPPHLRTTSCATGRRTTRSASNLIIAPRCSLSPPEWLRRRQGPLSGRRRQPRARGFITAVCRSALHAETMLPQLHAHAFPDTQTPVRVPRAKPPTTCIYVFPRTELHLKPPPPVLAAPVKLHSGRPWRQTCPDLIGFYSPRPEGCVYSPFRHL